MSETPKQTETSSKKKTPTAAPTLSTRQKQYLKGLAHSLDPYVQIGKEGLTGSIVTTVATELERHELIKVRIGNNSGLEKNETAEELASQSRAALIQLIGKVVVLYKPNPTRSKEKRIILPKG